MAVKLMRLLVLIWAMLLAPIVHAVEINFTGVGDTSKRAQFNGVALTYDAKFKLTTFLGEPLVSLVFRWKPDVPNTKVKIPVKENGKTRHISVPLNAIDPSRHKDVRLYDMKIQYRMEAGGRSYYIQADAGALSKGDGETWSFNVPGSPNWSKLLYGSSMASGGTPRYLSARDAKAAYKAGLVGRNIQIISVNTSLRDLQNWYARKSSEAKLPGRISALKKMARGVKRSFGYEVDIDAILERAVAARQSVSRSSPGYRTRGYDAELSVIQTALNKLRRLPKKFQDQGDDAAFKQGKKEALEEIDQNQIVTSRYRSKERSVNVWNDRLLNKKRKADPTKGKGKGKWDKLVIKRPKKSRNTSKAKPKKKRSAPKIAADRTERIWGYRVYYSKKGEGPSKGDIRSVHKNLGSRRGPVIALFQGSSTGSGGSCIQYSFDFLYVVEAMVTPADVAKVAGEKSIFKSQKELKAFMKRIVTQRFSRMADVSKPKKRPCPLANSNYPRPKW